MAIDNSEETRRFDLAGARHFARTRLGETGNRVADDAFRLLADACDEVERLRARVAELERGA